MDQPFNLGDRVYHEALGVYGTWVEAIPGLTDELTCSRVQLEDSDEFLLCPTSCLTAA